MALSYLATFVDEFKDLNLDVVSKRTDEEKEMVLKLVKSGFNSPLTSSMGRLFDAVSALLGICDQSTYEGQAAMELEMALNERTGDSYSFFYHNENGYLTINPEPLIRGICSDLNAGKQTGYISARFHNSIITMLVETCIKLRDVWKLNRIALSGGCFQNTYLLSRSIEGLTGEGFEVFFHQMVPPNDGGLALGQALIANEHLKSIKD